MFTLQEKLGDIFPVYLLLIFFIHLTQGYNTGILRRLISWFSISYWIAWTIMVCLRNTSNIISVKSLGLSGTPFEAIAKAYVNQIMVYLIILSSLRICSCG